MTSYVFVHGGFGGGWMWRDVAEILEGQGRGVECVDLPAPGSIPRR
jgi:hypothetical protein